MIHLWPNPTPIKTKRTPEGKGVTFFVPKHPMHKISKYHQQDFKIYLLFRGTSRKFRYYLSKQMVVLTNSLPKKSKPELAGPCSKAAGVIYNAFY